MDKRILEFTKAGKKAALEAGSYLRRNIARKGRISYKGAVDLVTNFDNHSQKMIFRHLSSRFPGHDFLAEEGLNRTAGAEFRWIFDPLDGTTNYAHGLPIFCVSIALEQQGRVVAGIVYDPMREEMFWSVAGKGAFLGKRRVCVSDTPDLNRSLIATGFPYDVRERQANNLDHFGNFLVRAQGIRRCGSAALDICYVACGRFDGYWELSLHPWDVAAAALIVREAGGRVTDFRGDEFPSFRPAVIASNGLIHQAMAEVLALGKT